MNGIKYCLKCGKQIPSDSLFCSYCGATQPSGSSQNSISSSYYTSTTTQKKQKKSSPFLSIIAAVAIIAIVGYALYPNYFNQFLTKVPVVKSVISTPTPSPVPKPTITPKELPKSGTVYTGVLSKRDSELTINTSTESCFVKLKDTSGKTVFSCFFRSNSKDTVAVPSGKFYIYFATGKDWYGTKDLFGADTSYSKDDDLKDFINYTWEYTLYPVTNGNFTETPISASEFAN